MEELKSSRYSPPAKKKICVKPAMINIGQEDNQYSTDCDSIKVVMNNDIFENNDDTCKIKRLDRVMFMYCMQVFNMDTLIASDPRLKKICADMQNHFINSRFKLFRFYKGKAHSNEELQEKVNDFKYLINLCGIRLKSLNVEAYPISEIMPFISTDCPNLDELILKFKEIQSQDFENVFSNMSHLEVLRINWQCQNSSLPLTLVKSLEQVGQTLQELCLLRDENLNHICLPDSLASVFPQLFTLKKLNIINFELSQSLLQSISEMKNLVHLRLMCSWLNNHPVFDKQINMCPIGNLENLETFYINFDCGVTDEFLINLCNNAKKLRCLNIIGKNITDNGMIALNNLKKLESLKLDLNGLEENVFITDQSIEYLLHEKLEYLNLSNCIKITNRSMLKLFKNMPNLNILYVRKTNMTFEVAREMLELITHNKKPIYIYVSFEDRDDMFKSLVLSGVFFKSNFNSRKYIDIVI